VRTFNLEDYKIKNKLKYCQLLFGCHLPFVFTYSPEIKFDKNEKLKNINKATFSISKMNFVHVFGVLQKL
jgi:hypothetical protein